MSPRRLTQKETLFVQEYLIDLNATQAAIRAGYSKDSAHTTGHSNIKKPEVQSAIFEAMNKRMKRTNVTQEQIILALKRIAFANIRDIMNWNDSSVNITPSEDLTRSKTYAIAEISENVNQHARTVKVRLKDSIRALELLGKHTGLFVDRTDPASGLHQELKEQEEREPSMTKERAEALLKEKMGK